MTAKEFRESMGVSLTEWNIAIEIMMDAYAKHVIEKALPNHKHGTITYYNQGGGRLDKVTVPHPDNTGYNDCINHFKQNLKKEGIEI